MTVSNRLISVLMPTYQHAAFIARAVRSLLAQTAADWELIIVDDASPDDTAAVIEPFCSDPRIRYMRRAENGGVGKSLNDALDLARGAYIAYLPSDDVYYADHLASLRDALEQNPDALLAYSGVRYNYNRFASGCISGFPMQLVQVIHRRTADRWVERETLVTDDWGRMYWDALEKQGGFISTERVTCEWVSHPAQLHRLMREPEGGINVYRLRFNVRHPLRFQSTIGNMIDEVAHYRRFRERPDTPLRPDGLKIVLVGELAYNPERLLALEERGHKLYGLWTRTPQWWNTVGPVPFGHVEDIPYDNWEAELRRIQPDIIYGLLNWQAVPTAHEVLIKNPGIPFVWHFKEGPFICLEKGIWSQLADLYTRSDGQIFCSPEMKDWLETTLAHEFDPARTLILDGDLPKREWFTDERSPLLSERDGEIHTVVPGRPIGLHPYFVGALAQQGIHIHFYGDYTQGQWKQWIDKVRFLAPHHLHLHPNVEQDAWVREFSQYDAGWLHFFRSRNEGEISRSTWDDLNYPARIATLAVCGLPMLQRDNSGSIVASQRLIESLDMGIFFTTVEELGDKLRRKDELQRIRENVWNGRHQFMFDHHADRLLAFFRAIIEKTPKRTLAANPR